MDCSNGSLDTTLDGGRDRTNMVKEEYNRNAIRQEGKWEKRHFNERIAPQPGLNEQKEDVLYQQGGNPSVITSCETGRDGKSDQGLGEDLNRTTSPL